MVKVTENTGKSLPDASRIGDKDRLDFWRHAVHEYVALIATYGSLDEIGVGGLDRVGNPILPLSRTELVRQLRHLCKIAPFHLERSRRSLDWSAVERLHQLIRDLLEPLIDGDEEDLGEHIARLKERGAADVVIRVGKNRQLEVRGEGALDNEVSKEIFDLALPNGGTFPLARCPACARVFVPAKNQRFHTANCHRFATRDKRREYMRQLMRNRRERQKASR